MFGYITTLLGLALVVKEDLTPAQRSISTVILGVGINSIVRKAESKE